MSVALKRTLRSGGSSAIRRVLHHVKNHIGVGIVCAVAYFDPGNWSVDLQAGSDFHYRPMLFVILMTGLGAIVLQTLSCKLGCVTGIDLASHCRLLLHDRPKHTRLIRYGVLYPLYVLSEIAIISTDLAELLGSAIGLVIIIPNLPLWGAVVLTAADVLAVLACFIVLMVKSRPDWPAVFMGYIPSKDLFKSEPNAIYTAVGMLGATIMPHALFLGSSLATQDRVALAPPPPAHPPVLPSSQPITRRTLKSRVKDFVVPLFAVSRAERAAAARDYRTKYGERENNSLAFIRQHLPHGVIDIITSLLGIAVPINSAILILAATVFYQSRDGGPAGLFDAHDLIKQFIGNGAAIVFALALICAGQAASITATLAGQVVSEGFIEWRISPFFRRLITRLISLIPSVIVAVSAGREGINTLLVASQVALSVVLPFIVFPLIYLTSSKVVMRVRKPVPPSPPSESDDQSVSSVGIGAYTASQLQVIESSSIVVSDREKVGTEKETVVEYHDKAEESIQIPDVVGQHLRHR
ncbi:hypothetical protein EYR36_007138 [Pleurotus pulmonarius]|nr:hypothetical protein EYR36_007138 [Pleurotus pulmonarius]